MRNVIPSPGWIGQADREQLLGQRGCVVWLTGLSGSGKSTIARELEATLLADGRLSYVLDGDNVRHGLNNDLGFSPSDRAENIRRLGEVAALFADAGVITITAFISPYRADRNAARAKLPEGRFLEVFCDALLAVCERRDPKGLYRRARAGQIAEFTGVDAPYEPPTKAELILPTGRAGVDECVSMVMSFLRQHGLLALATPSKEGR